MSYKSYENTRNTGNTGNIENTRNTKNTSINWKMYLILFIISVAIFLLTTSGLKQVRFSDKLVTSIHQ